MKREVTVREYLQEKNSTTLYKSLAKVSESSSVLSFGAWVFHEVTNDEWGETCRSKVEVGCYLSSWRRVLQRSLLRLPPDDRP